jgi:hypothetical protein
MAEEGVKSLMTTVGLLAIAGILVYFALLLMGMVQAPGWLPIPTIEYPSTLPSEELGSFTLTNLDAEEPHTTATEIACSIARAIRKDFLNYGDGNDRPQSSGDYRTLDPLQKDKTIVARGAFRIMWNTERGKFWAFEDLPLAMQTDLMKACTDTDESWHCGTEYLDEECVTNGLSHLKTGDNFICTKKSEPPARIDAGGALVDFGNDDCGASVADEHDDCGTLCPGGDRILAWRAPNRETITEYVDDSDWNTGDDWVPHECEGGKCQPLYAWLLIYNKDDNAYDVEIAQMAERTKELVGISANDLLNKLVADGHKFRSIDSSYAYPELRTRYDITFKITDQVTLSGLLTQFTNKLNSEESQKNWDVNIVQCFGDQCYDTAPEKRTWRVVEAPWSVGAPLSYDQSKDNEKIRKKLHLVDVRTNIENSDEYLNPDHTYRIIMRWWKVTKKSDTKDAGFGKVWCYESGGYHLPIRNTIDCKGDYAYAVATDYTRYQDQTLIIVDLGEESEWSTE